MNEVVLIYDCQKAGRTAQCFLNGEDISAKTRGVKFDIEGAFLEILGTPRTINGELNVENIKIHKFEYRSEP